MKFKKGIIIFLICVVFGLLFASISSIVSDALWIKNCQDYRACCEICNTVLKKTWVDRGKSDEWLYGRHIGCVDGCAEAFFKLGTKIEKERRDKNG